MAKEYDETIDDRAHETHGSDPYHFSRGHGHDDSYFKQASGHVTAADKPSNELHGHPNRQEFYDAYRSEMDTVGKLLDKPVQSRAAAADRYAHGGKRRG